MKRLVFLILIITSCLFVTAQPPAPGSNITNNNLDQFEGTWIWTNGGKTVTLMLKKVNKSFGTYTMDVLLGVHKFQIGPNVVEDNLNNFPLVASDYKKSSILLYQIPGDVVTTVRGSIDDLTRDKPNDLKLDFVPGTPNTIIWKMAATEQTTVDGNFQYGTTLPKDLILTKQ